MRKRAESECLAGLTSAACLYFSILTSCVEENQSMENINEVGAASVKRALSSPRKPSVTKRGCSKRNRSVSECVAANKGNAQQSIGADDCSHYYAADVVDRFIKNERNRVLPAFFSGMRHNKCGDDKFPFAFLPQDCKLKIFGFLTQSEKGIAGQVCQEWNCLIKSPCLWHDVDLRAFPLCHSKKRSHVCGRVCYANYRLKMNKYLTFLQQIRPSLKKLCFAFDIGDPEDRWLDSLDSFLSRSRLEDLEVAYMNWKETPVRPFWLEQMVWSSSECQEFMHRHRQRQRKFVNFFDKFTSMTPNVEQLTLPFDWSVRSLRCLSRLDKLKTLGLERYFVFQSLNQSSLDQLFHFVPHLQRLILEVWTPSGRGLQFYQIRSENLKYLDVSQCRGFYLKGMDLPSLEVFKISRHPWNGPLLSRDCVNIPCIYEVLREGAPQLRVINGHHLRPDWQDIVHPELEDILREECSCPKHKSGWCM